MMITTILVFFYLVAAAVAVKGFKPKGFEWPEEAEEMLRKGLQQSPYHRYTEAEADEFLANAMLHYVDDAYRGLVDRSSPFAHRTPFILMQNSGLYPRHRFVTYGIQQDSTREHATHFWFSLPLRVSKPDNPTETEFYHFPLGDGRMVRSLDVIRFERFHPRFKGGFWLPTAIVRPVYSPWPDKHLAFRVVYEYPTSIARYRSIHRDQGSEAPAAALRQAIEAKHPAWLGKLAKEEDKRAILSVWKKAPGSALIPKSPLFSMQERKDAGWVKGKATAKRRKPALPDPKPLLPDLNVPLRDPDEVDWHAEQDSAEHAWASTDLMDQQSSDQSLGNRYNWQASASSSVPTHTADQSL